LQHIITKARDAKHGGFGVLSTGEKLAAALVLNRPDWLAEMNYTLAEAIERVGPQWLALIPEAARVLEYEDEHVARRGLPCLPLEGKEGWPLEKGADAAMVEARIEGARLSLAEITERHMAAQKAAADVVREWDDRRAAGDVSSVAYASALLAVVTEEATARRLRESASSGRGRVDKRLQEQIPIGVFQSAVALVEQPAKVLGLGSAILDALDRESKHLVPCMLFLGKELVQSRLEPR
jgi:hypothetical protein